MAAAVASSRLAAFSPADGTAAGARRNLRVASSSSAGQKKRPRESSPSTSAAASLPGASKAKAGRAQRLAASTATATTSTTSSTTHTSSSSAGPAPLSMESISSGLGYNTLLPAHLLAPSEAENSSFAMALTGAWPASFFADGRVTSASERVTSAAERTTSAAERTTSATDAQARGSEVDELWLEIREEARRDAEEEPALASYLYSTVLAHRSFESALAAHLATKIASPTLLSSHLVSLFRDVLLQSPEVAAAVRRDIRAARQRDPACTSYLHCLLNFKGFSALQVHRVAHELWQSGRHSLALALQSRASEVFHVDIHPAAKFGSGVLLDHATGIVVGETAEVGDDVSMLHGVTLGGSGILGGVRHPKIGNGVVLGTGVRVLGPVIVGKDARIGAGSLVLNDVAEGTTVVGSPAREVRKKVALGSVFVIDYMI